MKRKRPPADVVELRATPPDRLMAPLHRADFPGGADQVDNEREAWATAHPRNTLTTDEHRRWLVGASTPRPMRWSDGAR